MSGSQTNMTKAELDALLNQAVLEAHAKVTELSATKQMPIGANLFCRVVWPKAHKAEHFLLVGPNPQAAINITALSEGAAGRMNERFMQWWALQEPHEQFAFVVRMDIRVMKVAEQSGLVLAR